MAAAQSASETTATVRGRTERVRADMDSVLRPGLRRLQAGGRESLGNVTETVMAARRNLGRADLRAQTVEQRLEELTRLDADVSQKLRQLKNKILKARQAATNVRPQRGVG